MIDYLISHYKSTNVYYYSIEVGEELLDSCDFYETKKDCEDAAKLMVAKLYHAKI